MSVLYLVPYSYNYLSLFLIMKYCFHNPNLFLPRKKISRQHYGYGLVAEQQRTLLPTQETWVQSLGQEDSRRRKRQSTLTYLPGKSRGQSSLVGYSPCGHKSQAGLREWTTANNITIAWYRQSEISHWTTCNKQHMMSNNKQEANLSITEIKLKMEYSYLIGKKPRLYQLI